MTQLIDPSKFTSTVGLLRSFFLEKGFLEVHTQNRLSILAACEDPFNVATYNYAGQVWPLPQTGQMWLEHELLSQPSAKGFFCVSTSYRQEPNAIPGRHDIIFPIEILRLNRGEAQGNESAQPQEISQQTIFEARQEVLNIHMADTIEQYIIRLVMATRQPKQYSDQLDQWLDMGVSPRATIALDRCARAHAWLAGRDYVTPQDVQTMAFPVLRHRLLRSYHAQAEGVTANQVIAHLISLVGSA